MRKKGLLLTEFIDFPRYGDDKYINEDLIETIDQLKKAFNKQGFVLYDWFSENTIVDLSKEINKRLRNYNQTSMEVVITTGNGEPFKIKFQCKKISLYY